MHRIVYGRIDCLLKIPSYLLLSEIYNLLDYIKINKLNIL